MKQIHKTIYLRGKEEAEKSAVERNKKLKRLAKQWNLTEAGVLRKLLDDYKEK